MPNKKKENNTAAIENFNRAFKAANDMQPWFMMKLIQAANQHQDCDALTQQIMDLRKQKEKVQSRETDQQAKLHSLDEINESVEFYKYGLVDFDEGLVRPVA